MLKKNVIQAYSYAKEMHQGQKRAFSKLDYFTHPKYVARIIEQLTNDEDLVIVALLHDVIEDTPATYKDIKNKFGKTLADLVFELTNKIPKNTTKKLYMLEKMQNLSEPALTVKLADRLHNVIHLEYDHVNINFIKKYYTETKYILDNLERPLNKIQEALLKRISSILDFLEIRYDF